MPRTVGKVAVAALSLVRSSAPLCKLHLERSHRLERVRQLAELVLEALERTEGTSRGLAKLFDLIERPGQLAEPLLKALRLVEHLGDRLGELILAVLVHRLFLGTCSSGSLNIAKHRGLNVRALLRDRFCDWRCCR